MGTFQLSANLDHAVRLNDNTGEKYVKGKSPALVYQYLKVEPAIDVRGCATPPCGDNQTDAGGGSASPTVNSSSGGCHVKRSPVPQHRPWTLVALTCCILAVVFRKKVELKGDLPS